MSQPRRTSQSLAAPENPKALADARALLAKLLPVARGRARELTAGHASPMFAQMKPYATTANMLGVFVYETEDGWYADLAFRRVPQGLPGIIGNPVANPFRSRKDALDGAITLIASAIAIETDVTPIADPDPTRRAFNIDSVWLSVPLDLVEAAGRGSSEMGITLAEARAQLGRLLAADFGDQEVTEAGLTALGQPRTAHYMATIAVMLSHGIFRYTSAEPPLEFYDEKVARTKPAI